MQWLFICFVTILYINTIFTFIPFPLSSLTHGPPHTLKLLTSSSSLLLFLLLVCVCACVCVVRVYVNLCLGVLHSNFLQDKAFHLREKLIKTQDVLKENEPITPVGNLLKTWDVTYFYKCILFVCTWVYCLCICLFTTFVPSTYRGKNMALSPLKLELQRL